jgi:type I restriction enzyme S subunit
MSAEWKDIQLGELATFKYGKFLAKSQLDESGFPVFSGYGIVGYLPTYQFDDPQLLIVCRGEGGTGDVKMSPSKCSITNLSIVLSPNEQIVSRKFLYWALKASDTHRLRTGSAQAQIVIGSLEKLGIVIPTDRFRQDGIARTLDALDDRITLLRETNATLEAIAQALFKSWFVDFDPVRAKLEGRAPEGMDEATARLLPNSFEESELGLVPRGWRVGVLGDVAQTNRKQLQPSDLHAGLHYVGLEHIPRQSLSLTDWGTADGLESAKAAFSAGDILFGKLRPYFHKVVVAPFDGVCSTDILVCQAKLSCYYGFVAMQLFSVALIDYADRLSNGAKMPRVGWKDLAAYPVVVPSESVAIEFTEAIDPLLARMKANVHEAQNLATLRDTLLPRLISGQLRLPTTTRIISSVHYVL